MSDHDHRGEYSDIRHEHGYYDLAGVAEEHHRHHHLEEMLSNLRASVTDLEGIVEDLRNRIYALEHEAGAYRE